MFILLAIMFSMEAFAAQNPIPTLEDKEYPQRASVSRDDFVALLMKLVPGRSTQQAALRALPPPSIQSQTGSAIVFGYRLDAPVGGDFYDVFLAFREGILVQVERPALDTSLTW